MKKFFAVIAAAALIAAAPAIRAHAEAAVQGAQPTRAREPHPRIRSAIKALDAAKAELKAAPHDFGGHRVEAIAAIDAAVTQLNLALAYDKK